MSDRKIFLSDLDGTILTDEKKISPGTKKALTDFVNRGNTFAVCTGRDINSARAAYRSLELDVRGSFAIAYNGAQIYDIDNEKTVYRTGVEISLVAEILALAKEFGIHVHTYNDDFILSPAYNECMDFYRRVIKTPLIVADDIVKFLDKAPGKLICIELHDHAKQEKFREMIEERYGDILNLMYSNDYYLELIPKESGKGNALLRLAEYLGVKTENTIAAGDADNDISMIQAAGLGVAMINASDTTKAAADVVTESDNNHDGLQAILENA
ncbi:MAG: HAD family phosphatase [Eubacterium sp.]|nr:HAD family phosphatase [Eubacterium sp.]